MERFSLEKYLENPSRKVVTRDGRSVRVVCTDSPDEVFPIVGFVENEITTRMWQATGEYNNIPDCVYDLFFADEEKKLADFEKELEKMMVSFSNGNLGSDAIKEMPKQKLHDYAHRLLDLARKEIEQDLPKWKKITKREQNYLVYGYLSNDEYYLRIQELKDKLPKEE